MKIRKNVLLYCADIDLAERVSYVLHIRNGYYSVRVTGVSTAKDFLWESSDANADFDCVVVIRSKLGCLSDDQLVFELLNAANAGSLTVDVQNGLGGEEYCCAQRSISGDAKVAIAQIIDTVRIACGRKRGPATSHGFAIAQIGVTA